MKPNLCINRMVVLKGGTRVYDQEFHNGLNIIRGSNGSGKSTIVDLMFHALGGELGKWKKHASLCDEVILEVSLSGSITTLRREIDSGKKMRPMRIFHGTFQEAINSSFDGWGFGNFTRDKAENRRSFSQILFEIIGLPEIPGDQGTSITIHQILRLMYVDQISPFQRIFRSESFDAKDTRQAIAELLCGIGGSQLFAKKIERRKIKSEFDDVSAKYTNLKRATFAFEQNIILDAIDGEITVTQQKIDVCHSELQNLETVTINESVVAKNAASERKKLLDVLSALKTQIISLEHKEKSIKLEISDSSAFLHHLEVMLNELTNATVAFVTLGNVKFESCPACFSPIHNDKEEHCHLCGTKTNEEERKAKTVQLRLDFEGQIKESEALQKSRVETLESVKRSLQQNRIRFSRTTKQLDDLERLPVDGRTALIAKTSREIGGLEARLDELSKLQNIAEDLSSLSIEKGILRDSLSELDSEIKSIEFSLEKRKGSILTKINNNAKYFLERDMTEHQDFDTLEDFKFSFEDDWFAVNGDPNISTSASGMVVLKNCLMLGILKTSLEDQLMSYPGFLIQDNGEDKGMVPDRVQHFQKMMATWSDSTSVPHQIILTTSTICPELEVDGKYVVGPKYNKEHKTLSIL